MLGRRCFAAAFVVGVSASAFAQSHAPSTPAAADHGAATTQKSPAPSTEKAAPAAATPTPAAKNERTHAPAAAKAEAGAPPGGKQEAAKAEGHAAEGATADEKPKPKPKVSSVLARPAAHDAPAADAHGSVVGMHQTAAKAREADAGYVATGSKKTSEQKKSRPTVSAGAMPSAKSEPEGEAHPAPAAATGVAKAEAGAGPHVSPGASHVSPTASTSAPAPAESARRTPTKLADVHERLTTALAELREEMRAAEEKPARNAAPSVRRPSEAARADALPRVVVTWPGPRWLVQWPGPGRFTLTWPLDAPAPQPARLAVPH